MKFEALLWLYFWLATNVIQVTRTDSLPVTEPLRRVCSREGLMCRDCTTLVRCIAKGNTFIETEEQYCTDKSPCDETTLTCSESGTCRYAPFKCPEMNNNGVLLFSDPYSCRQYHKCSKSEQYSYICPAGSSFNPASQKCDLTLQTDRCLKSPIAPCLAEDEYKTSFLQNGTQYYFKCYINNDSPKTIYPILEIQKDSKLFADDLTTDTLTENGDASTTIQIMSSGSSDSEGTEQTSLGSTETVNDASPSTNPEVSESTITEKTESTNSGSSEMTDMQTESTTVGSSGATDSVPSDATDSAASDANTDGPSDTTDSGISDETTDGSSDATDSGTSVMPTIEETGTTDANESETTSYSSEATSNVAIETTSISSSTSQDDYECTAEGSFEDKNDCHGYFVCYRLPDGQFGNIHQRCRSGSHFDPLSQKCSKGDCGTKTSTLPLKTTKIPPPPYNCPSPGYFLDQNDCYSFYFCYTLPNGNFGEEHETCRSGSHYDPVHQKCIKGSCKTTTVTSIQTSEVAMNSNPTSEETTNETISERTTVISTYSCSSAGYFPDGNDCYSFFLCYSLPNGGFGQKHLKCRPGSHFDSSRGRCVKGSC